MEGYSFLVCCVLVLTIYELGGETARVEYKVHPITESKEDELNIKLVLTQDDAQDNRIDFNFTLTPLNKTLTFTPSKSEVSADKTVFRQDNSNETIVEYISHVKLAVSVIGGTDGVLTGNLMATPSCDHLICKDNVNDKSVVLVIVKETKTLKVTAATATRTESHATASVTVTLSKDLATSDNITISVLLHNKDQALEECSDCSSERVLVHEAKSSTKVVFHDIKWGEYQLIIGCGNDSVCSALSQWIHFPEPVSVSAHPPYSQLSETIFKLNRTIIDLKRKLAYCSANSSNLQGNVTALQKKLKNNCTYVPTPTLSPSGSSGSSSVTSGSSTDVASTSTSAPTDIPSSTTTTPPPSPPETTTSSPPANNTSPSRYMEFAVGGLIAVLVCGLLAYLIYHYRTMLKEWICSKKAVVSNLPKNLRRKTGSKYTKLPRTMQEALHQD